MRDLLEQHFPQFREPELINDLLSKAQKMSFKAGELVLKKDSYIKVIPLVCSGLLKVLQEGEEYDLLMYYIEPGESCIMSITACFKNEKSKIKAVVEEDAELLLIPTASVIEWSKLYPSWNEYTGNLYQKRFLNLLDGFNSVVYDKIEDRLKHYLIQKAELLDTKELHITHKKIAEDLGKAREVISRLLKALEDEGKIKLQRAKIVLIDL